MLTAMLPRDIARDIVDPQTTMSASVRDDIVTIAYPHPDYVGTRREASVIAREYARNRRERAVFMSHRRHFDLGAHNDTVIYRYRLIAR